MIIVPVTSKLFNFYNFSGLDGTTSLSAFSSRLDTDAYHFVSPLEAVSIIFPHFLRQQLNMTLDL